MTNSMVKSSDLHPASLLLAFRQYGQNIVRIWDSVYADILYRCMSTGCRNRAYATPDTNH